jgi:hypothetical protein
MLGGLGGLPQRGVDGYCAAAPCGNTMEAADCPTQLGDLAVLTLTHIMALVTSGQAHTRHADEEHSDADRSDFESNRGRLIGCERVLLWPGRRLRVNHNYRGHQEARRHPAIVRPPRQAQRACPSRSAMESCRSPHTCPPAAGG